MAEVACTSCGRTAGEPPATWSSEVTVRGTTWLCEDCTRQHVRAIEARLDETWW